MGVLSELQPQLVWDIFEEITKVPRPSKKEEKIIAWTKEFGKKYNCEMQEDKLGNLVLRKPATPGMEDRKAIVIQGHVDMVCEKNSDVEFDFDNDPIQVYIDGDWVKAKGTTLGADNGIGVAMGLALIASTDIPHPALEVLCTLDEETGLTGAMQLGTDLLQADILINLDSEEDGAFTIGCAGGQNTAGTFKYDADAVPAGVESFKLVVKGLQGGHSGIEIHDGRANAIKLLNRILFEASSKFDIRLASMNAGSAHNAIPREAFAVVTVANEHVEEFKAFVAKCEEIYKDEWISKEPNIAVFTEAADKPAKVMTKEFAGRFIQSIYAMPHGPLRYSPDIDGLVQTSTNLSIVETRDMEIYVLTSQRSSVETEKKDMANMVRIALELGGAVVKQGDGYPAWQPNMNSPILKAAVEMHKKVRGFDPKIEAIHAGLECGLVGEKYPHMDMLSFGPNLKDVHSPDEKIQISTVEHCWNLLKEIVQNIPVK
jgi:dipeptidase D